ncbi:hypothetical protein [Halorientalis pallida]|nr:hypothetical protein [Halorientalis pallida]
MTRYSASRGIMYSAPPTDDDDEEAAEATPAAENGEAATADD